MRKLLFLLILLTIHSNNLYSFQIEKIIIQAIIEHQTFSNSKLECLKFDDTIKKSKMAIQIKDLIFDDLKNFNSKENKLQFGSKGYDEKVDWIISGNNFYTDIYIETKSIWLGKLLYEYLNFYKERKCFKWKRLKLIHHHHNNIKSPKSYDPGEITSYDTETSNLSSYDSYNKIINNPPTTLITIPNTLRHVTFFDIQQRLKYVLNECGYANSKVGVIPMGESGFQIITQIEQINKNLTPKTTNSERWNADDAAKPEIKSIIDYLRLIFSANIGYYRVYLFKFTGKESIPKGPAIEYDDMIDLFTGSPQSLPISEREKKVDGNYIFSVWVYEFKKNENARTCSFITKGAHQLGDAQAHLEQSKLYHLLINHVLNTKP